MYRPRFFYRKRRKKTEKKNTYVTRLECAVRKQVRLFSRLVQILQRRAFEPE